MKKIWKIKRFVGLAIGWSVGLSLLVASPVYAGEPRPSDESSIPAQKEAGEWASLAKDAVKNENFDEALAAFTQAYKASRDDVYLFNMAMCLQVLNRYGEAMDYFDRCRKSGDIDVANRAEKAQDALRNKFGYVTLRNLNTDATVMLDDNNCTVENNTLWIPAGDHEIAISKPGYVPRRYSVTVNTGESVSIDAALAHLQPVESVKVPLAVVDKPEEENEPSLTPPSSRAIDDTDVGVPLPKDIPSKPKRPIVGWVMLGTGLLTAGIIGGIYTSKYISDYKKGQVAKENAVDAYYNWEPHEEYLEELNHYNQVVLPRNRRGIIFGTASGGLIAFTGVGILIWDKLKSSKTAPLSVAHGGLSVPF